MSSRQEKTCARCGRTFSWRKRWARDWDNIRFCSDRCRRQGIGENDRALEAAILNLLKQRARGATLCPSEAARAVFGSDSDEWKAAMASTREAARRLVAEGRLVITQGGKVVDPSRARGPIRLRLR